VDVVPALHDQMIRRLAADRDQTAMQGGVMAVASCRVPDYAA
jgi:hypothetical protein